MGTVKCRLPVTLICTALAAGLTGLATRRAAAESPSDKLTDVQTKLYELMDKDITKVKFNAGSAILSESERSNLNRPFQIS